MSDGKRVAQSGPSKLFFQLQEAMGDPKKTQGKGGVRKEKREMSRKREVKE